jgi:hypothetical protein
MNIAYRIMCFLDRVGVLKLPEILTNGEVQISPYSHGVWSGYVVWPHGHRVWAWILRPFDGIGLLQWERA